MEMKRSGKGVKREVNLVIFLKKTIKTIGFAQ